MSSEVRNALHEFQKARQVAQMLLAEVVEVNEKMFTCVLKPIDGGAEFHGVRLKPTLDSDDHGVIAIPVKGSVVMFGLLNRSAQMPIILRYTLVSKYIIKLKGDASVVLFDNGTMQFNGDSFGGLVKVQELVARLNALERAFNTHIHSGVTTGGGVSGSPPVPVTLTTRSQIENVSVKHGK